MFKQFGRRAAVLVMVVLLLAAVPVASAQEVRSGGSVTVPAGAVVDDLQVLGGTVTIAGTVDGDVSGVAGTVVVTDTGRVTGDLSVAAGSVVIQGVLEGTLSGGVGDVTVAEGASVGGDLLVGAGSLTLDGAVGGSVEAGVATLVVGPTATVGGDLRYDDDTDATIAAGATVAGVTERTSLGGSGAPFVGDVPGAGLAGTFVGAVFLLLANAALGVLLLLAAPGFARRVTHTGRERAAASGLVGLGAAVAVPVLLVLLAVTVVGIPLSVAGALASLPFLWVVYVYGALVTGSWLATYADSDSLYAGLAVGLALAALAAFVPFGGLLTVAYLLLGLGSFVLSALDLRTGRGREGDSEEGGPASPGPEPEPETPTTPDGDTDGDAGIPSA